MRLLLIIALLTSSMASLAQEYTLFVGTYSRNGSKGIYTYRFDAQTGNATWLSNTDTASNPSYLAIAPNGRFLYSVFEEGKGGRLSAYAIDKPSGRLTLLNQQSSGGANPCYVAITRDGKWLTAGNYGGGSLSLLTINADGSLGEPVQVIQHSGNSVNKARQEKPHVHATVFSPSQEYLFVPDLGMDKVVVYRFDTKATKPLQAAEGLEVSSEPGNGPRHFVFHPNGRYAYLVEELSGTVAAYKYNKGKLDFLQRISTHPSDYKGSIGSADIHVSPDGKFLYASNRGDANTITIFALSPSSGKLQVKGFQSTMGEKPRNFMINPTGNYLLAANESSNTIVVFKRNKKTGLLHDTGKRIEVPSPVCLKMMKR